MLTLAPRVSGNDWMTVCLRNPWIRRPIRSHFAYLHKKSPPPLNEHSPLPEDSLPTLKEASLVKLIRLSKLLHWWYSTQVCWPSLVKEGALAVWKWSGRATLLPSSAYNDSIEYPTILNGCKYEEKEHTSNVQRRIALLALQPSGVLQNHDQQGSKLKEETLWGLIVDEPRRQLLSQTVLFNILDLCM